MRRIGIDFGTCNIKGAEKSKNGSVRKLKLGKKVDTEYIPNAILYQYQEESGRLTHLLGKSAIMKASPDSADLIRHIKLYLQKENWQRTLSFGKTVRAEDVTSDIMRSLFDGIHGASKTQELAATITVPVNFSQRQRGIVQRAAESAGFQVDSVITEPFAAFFFLMREAMDDGEEHHALILDVGGGTLDTCLVSMSDERNGRTVRTQAAAGFSFGGEDINEGIIRHVFFNKAPESMRVLLEESDNAWANRIRLLEAIEGAKMELFEDDSGEDKSTELTVATTDGKLFPLELSTSEVRSVLEAENLAKRLESTLRRLFDESEDLIPSEVTDVFLVGGSTSIPFFRENLEAFFRKCGGEADVDALFERNDDMDPEERMYYSVSCGAAIYQELLRESGLVIRDRIPFVIYTRDPAGRKLTRLTANDCMKEYYSPYSALAPFRDEGKIRVYQTVFSEEEKEVYLGGFPLNGKAVEDASLYRLFVDGDRNIYIDYGALVSGAEAEAPQTTGRDKLQIET